MVWARRRLDVAAGGAIGLGNGSLREANNDSDLMCFFFFQAEDGIRDVAVTGVQTCALPISPLVSSTSLATPVAADRLIVISWNIALGSGDVVQLVRDVRRESPDTPVVLLLQEIGRASCRERV